MFYIARLINPNERHSQQKTDNSIQNGNVSCFIGSIKMNTLIKALQNTALTENGAMTNASTLNKVLDFFFHGAALRREADEARIISLFDEAYAQDPLRTLKIMFYIRDVRMGQGERRVFRILLAALAKKNPEWVKSNVALAAEYGRWDDLLPLLNCDETAGTVAELLHARLRQDLENLASGTQVSLLAKWMPSENTSSEVAVGYAKKFRKLAKMDSKEYRKSLSRLRAHLHIVENNMRERDYVGINYSQLPALAFSKHTKAFRRNDKARLEEFLAQVRRGERKINASVLYPYDILRHVLAGDAGADEQWAALPDYVPEINGLVVYDTSGSMAGLPVLISTSLAIYVAERNKSSVWKNCVIPFSSKAYFKKVPDGSLAQKCSGIHTGDCSSTNLQAVFDLILCTAVKAHCPAEEMPKTLLVISDMEFNAVGFGLTNYDVIKAKYADAGYALPKVVWWNVESRNNQTPIIKNDSGLLLSGASAAMLTVALSGDFSVEEAMDAVIMQERYEVIQL